MTTEVNPLTIPQLIGLVSFAMSMATGQVLFKLGATKAIPAEGLQNWINLIFQPVVIFALCLYAAYLFLPHVEARINRFLDGGSMPASTCG